MSADEIKALAQQVYCDGLSVKHGGFEHMSSRIRQCCDALIAYAAMVERCEEKIAFANRIGGMYRHSQLNVLEMLDYILKGETK